jgi:tetratricopeptide (TPR) repeat protein
MKQKIWPILLIAILLFIPLGFIQNQINYETVADNLQTNLVLMPGEAGDMVLAGFKGIAADLLWINVENYWHRGEHFKMIPLFYMVTLLQPHWILAWSLGGWHMAYNVPAGVKNIQGKYYWYQQGIQFLKKGVSYNSSRYDLYFETGWTYYNKGEDYSNAVKYLKQAVIYPGPDYVKDVLAHAYEKDGHINQAIKEWKKLLHTDFKGVAKRMIYDLNTRGWATP